jgi:hypothetical protein
LIINGLGFFDLKKIHHSSFIIHHSSFIITHAIICFFMKNAILLLAFGMCAIPAFSQINQAPDAAAAPSDGLVRYKSALDANLETEAFEVEYFGKTLASLKSAFAANDPKATQSCEKSLVDAMRQEISQMEEKVASEAAQRARRARANSGVAEPAGATPKPKYDPFAEAETDSEKRLETMRYTLGAFERHAFNPAKPEEAQRDFARLDAFLKAMEEELAALKQSRK